MMDDLNQAVFFLTLLRAHLRAAVSEWLQHHH
jgi:hypothetical protein